MRVRILTRLHKQMFLVLGLVMLLSLTIYFDDIHALKSSGKTNQKYGSDTKAIVCGDQLCSLISNPNQQGRFQIGGITQQSLGNPGSSDLIELQVRDSQDSKVIMGQSDLFNQYIAIAIKDEKGKIIAIKTVLTDDKGGFEYQIKLPKSGNYKVAVNAPSESGTVTEEISIKSTGAAATLSQKQPFVEKQLVPNTKPKSEQKSEIIKTPPKQTPQSESGDIPGWVKSSLSFWIAGTVSDGEMIDATKYLVDNNVIKIKAKSKEISNSRDVPKWIKQTAKFYLDNMISEKEFKDALTFLIEKGIVRIGA